MFLCSYLLDVSIIANTVLTRGKWTPSARLLLNLAEIKIARTDNLAVDDRGAR